MSTTTRHVRPAPSPRLDLGFVWARTAAASIGSDHPRSSLGVKKNKIKKIYTHKTRRNCINSIIINKIFSKPWTNLVDFVAQNDPFQPQNGLFLPPNRHPFPPRTEGSAYPASSANSASPSFATSPPSAPASARSRPAGSLAHSGSWPGRPRPAACRPWEA